MSDEEFAEHAYLVCEYAGGWCAECEQDEESEVLLWRGTSYEYPDEGDQYHRRCAEARIHEDEEFLMTKTTNAPNAGDAAGMVEAARERLMVFLGVLDGPVTQDELAEFVASFAASRTAALQRENAALIEQRDAYKEACAGYEAVIAEGREDAFGESVKKATNGVIDHLLSLVALLEEVRRHYADEKNWYCDKCIELEEEHECEANLYNRRMRDDGTFPPGYDIARAALTGDQKNFVDRVE